MKRRLILLAAVAVLLLIAAFAWLTSTVKGLE